MGYIWVALDEFGVEEYLPPADDMLPAEEQPLPAAVSPTAESPGYITKSEPEMEPEENDEDDEKSKGDSIDYPTTEGDNDANDDVDDLSEDDADDEDKEESSDSEEEEEEHLAPTILAPALCSSKMAPKRARTTRANPDPTRTTTATEPMTHESINNLIAQRVAEAIAEYKTQRNSVVNGDTSNTTGTGPRTGLEKNHTEELNLCALNVTSTMMDHVVPNAPTIVRVPFEDETLIIRCDGSNNGNQLNIISCTKTRKYLLKGYPFFLVNITTKMIKDKSKEKQLEDVPIVRDFSEVFPEDLP
nr:putative reverse transcriptase domain-containing protein [Tanacetum cinerariifolium]